MRLTSEGREKREQDRSNSFTCWKQWSPTSNASSASAPLSVRSFALLKQLSPMCTVRSAFAWLMLSDAASPSAFDIVVKAVSTGDSIRKGGEVGARIAIA